MDDIMTKHKNRFLYLKKAYEISDGKELFTLDMWKIGQGFGLSRSDTQEIVQYLTGATLIRSVALGGSIAITHNGIVEYESAVMNPKNFSNFFPSVDVISVFKIPAASTNIQDETYNKVKIEGNMKNKIFIIHGHDNGMKVEVQLFLSRLGMDDVVLHECADKGRTVIDKLIEESSSACYAIALLSPDDKTLDSGLRARQNVILEIGYFLGKLGKDKVRLLKKENVEIPSDLQGVLFQPYDEHGAWKMKLAKEIEAVGIQVDIAQAMQKL